MEIEAFLVQVEDDLRRVIAAINASRNGIALVVDEARRLIGTVTDGDIRRHILSGGGLDEACAAVMNSSPIFARADTPLDKVHDLIRATRVRVLPVVDRKGRPVRIMNLSDLLGAETQTVAVVMAGGEGRRLRPLTEHLPKPMVNIGGKPLLERILLNLKASGIAKVFISVNFHAEKIESYFGSGADLGMDIAYLREPSKLGTAGSLSLLPNDLAGPVLVVNGDIMTTVDLRHFVDFHRNHRSAMSVAASEYNVSIPFGVLTVANSFVTGLEEKPTRRFLCNAGIYMLEPEIVYMVPKREPFDMTQLLGLVAAHGLPVAAFPIHEYWVDIGQHEDLQRARQDCLERAELGGGGL